VELESVRADTRLPPADWRRAAAHARDTGLGFRHWEIGNEVYTSIWKAGGEAFGSPSDYVDHVVAVSRAIREVQPDARIGISIKPDHIQWGNRVLAATAGHYDFVCPHLYDFTQAHAASFEDVVISANHARLDEALRLGALLRAYNPERQVSIYDTEWGLHSAAASGGKAWAEPRNANIVGTLHRAVRMLYYAREEVVEGGAGWNLFSNSHNPGFLVIARDQPERRSMLYWLHYHFTRHLGDRVVALEGKAPYHPEPGNPAAAGHPLTPALATLSADGKALFLMLVNGSWDRDVPARITLANFPAATCRAVILRHDDPTAHPLLERDEDFVGELPVTLTPSEASVTLPSHSIVFLAFSRIE
jgi:alpha-L-arabinofuranosidase